MQNQLGFRTMNLVYKFFPEMKAFILKSTKTNVFDLIILFSFSIIFRAYTPLKHKTKSSKWLRRYYACLFHSIALSTSSNLI